MSEHALEAAAKLLARRVGFRLDPTNRSRLTRAVRDEAVARGLDLTTYVAALDADPAAVQDLLNRVTVQETAFFRDLGQFRALADFVIPALRDAGAPVLVWSAGAANGQEAYSLAMALVEGGITSWRVIASDISTKALGRVRDARYRESEISGLSPDRRARFLAGVEGERHQWEVVPELRARVFGMRHNLAADPPPFEPGQCQVVFCRNVLIYFGHDDVAAFIDRLATRMEPSGYLFLGYSESLFQVSDRFHLVRLGEAFVYRKGVAPAPPAATRSPSTSPATPARRQPAPRLPARTEAPTRVRTDASAPVTAPAAEPTTTSVELLAIGEVALGDGDHAAAVAAFRKAAYLDVDHPIAHLNLGLALEASGDAVAARRAFVAARAALDRRDSAVIEAMLEGYHLDELVRLLDRKVEEE